MTSNRTLGPVTLVCVATLLMGASDYISIRPSEPSYATRIGLFYQCLAIRNHELQPGTPVTIIRFNSGEDLFADGSTLDRRVAGKILGKEDSAEQCPSLHVMTSTAVVCSAERFATWQREARESGAL